MCFSLTVDDPAGMYYELVSFGNTGAGGFVVLPDFGNPVNANDKRLIVDGQYPALYFTDKSPEGGRRTRIGGRTTKTQKQDCNGEDVQK